MKKYLLFVFLTLLLNYISSAQTLLNISKDEAWNIVKEKVLGNNTKGIEVYVSPKVLGACTTVPTVVDIENSPPFDSWFFFIDDMPLANWSHPCRYVYVDVCNGTYSIKDMKFPPLFDDMCPIDMSGLKMDMGGLCDTYYMSGIGSRSSNSASLSLTNHEYAVIISGGVFPFMNNVRYWNDCSAIYRTLINVYGYSKDHIYVLMSDGTDPNPDLRLLNGSYISSPLDLDGDGVPDIQYAATRTNIASVFNTLSSMLNSGDNLFIFTIDHGNQIYDKHTALCLWNNEQLHDYEFASYINSINANKISICMGQCYSGGFLDNITSDRVVISTACNYNEQSFAMSNLLYDEYVYHWISAVAGENPSGTIVNADLNSDGRVSMNEAYFYAKTNDLQSETPQYLSKPYLFGYDTWLHQELILVGPENICGITVYSIENIPPACNVNWHFSGSSSLNSVIYPSGYFNGMCAINNYNNYYINETLVATISLDGVVWGDCSMRVSTAGDFSATLQNTGGTIGEKTYPTFNTSFYDDAHQGVFENCQLILSSQDFDDCNFTFSGFTPTQWNVVGCIIYAQFPSVGNSPQICDVIGRQNTGCKIFHFQLIVLPGFTNPNSLLDNVCINMSNRSCIVTLNKIYSEIECEDTKLVYSVPLPNQWYITVSNMKTGRTVVQKRVEGYSTYLDTSVWEPGLYIVTCDINGKKISKKIIIK